MTVFEAKDLLLLLYGCVWDDIFLGVTNHCDTSFSIHIQMPNAI